MPARRSRSSRAPAGSDGTFGTFGTFGPAAALFAFALLALSMLSAGCTRTVYMVQGPDGSWQEVEGEQTFPGGDPALTDDGLTIQVLTSSEYVLIGEPQPVHVMFEVAAAPVEVEHRGPLNLGIVIDRSGSMEGAKLADAKAAAHQLLDELADGDRVSIVTYASDVSVDVPTTPLNGQTRGRLHQAIDAMWAGGGTHLSGGLEAAAEQVRRTVGPDVLSRIILLSDGRANVGETDPRRLVTYADMLRERGVSVTTMGLGVDYNEELMTSLAIAGGGNYWYVERSDRLRSVFDTELSAISSTITRDMVLELDLPPGVQVEDVHGYRHRQQGRHLEVFVHGVSAGQKRRLLVSLRTDGRGSGQAVIAKPRVSYRNELTKKQRSVELPPVKVAYTRDRQRVASSISPRVVEKLEAVRNAQARETIVRHLDHGDRDSAMRVLRARMAQSDAVQKRVKSKDIARQQAELERMETRVQGAGAPSSPSYKRMRKAAKKEAYDANMF